MFIIFVQWRKAQYIAGRRGPFLVGLLRVGLINVLVQVQSEQLLTSYGGIGRRGGLKIRFPQGSVGSTPTMRTKHHIDHVCCSSAR